MNGDVAKILQPIIKNIGNVVVIDHYVKDPSLMGSWIDDLHTLYPEAKVVIGEFGAPIPDLNGDMTKQQQADFVDLLFQQILLHDVAGVNYWDIKDGSTALINSNDSERQAYKTVQKYYTANIS